MLQAALGNMPKVAYLFLLIPELPLDTNLGANLSMGMRCMT
jgi:hypothetical protein